MRNKIDKDLARPSVFAFNKPVEFLRAIYAFYKKKGGFSVSQRTLRIGTLSQAMISQILSGRRNLTRDNLPSVAAVFKLTKIEQDFLDQQLLEELTPHEYRTIPVQRVIGRETKNHILNDWLHPYVKDLIYLKNFSPEPIRIYKLLSGIATIARIKRSMQFLIKEGFWRKDPEGKIVLENPSVVTTTDIPNEDIRNFHKKALDIARHGLIHFPPEKRKASTILVSVDKDKVEELRNMVENFENQLIHFIENNPHGTDQLMQIVLHLTPVGGLLEQT